MIVRYHLHHSVIEIFNIHSFLKYNSVQKSKLYGLIGSTLSSTLILLILWFVVLSAPSSTETEGFLVGFGTRYAQGCTSGHGILGLSALQWPSLVATASFFLGGILFSKFILPYILAL